MDAFSRKCTFAHAHALIEHGRSETDELLHTRGNPNNGGTHADV